MWQRMEGKGFIDRSKVRILLCDNDSNGPGEVFTLLCKCSYQVISVKSPRQVIDALNAEGPDIDIILSEVDLPMAKGLKMLKYIMRKGMQRIPVIMMSAQDEVTLVVKCLRLGAADYLVKPLRSNELLNLWTHMWRRRRMLGLTEKKLINCEFDMEPSDHSDVHTTSTMFSDDTDEKSWKSSNPDISLSIHHGNEINVILAPGSVNTQLANLLNDQCNPPETNDHQQGQLMSGPKKSELKIGQSSAFFSYIKSSMPKNTTPAVSLIEETTILPRIHKEPQPSLHVAEVDGPTVNSNGPSISQRIMPRDEHAVSDAQGHYHTQPRANLSITDDFHGSNSYPDSVSLDDSSTPTLPAEFSQQMTSNMKELRNNSHLHVSGYNTHSAFPYYLQGTMNQVMMSSSSSMYNANYPPHHMPGMASFPYYPPVNLCAQPGQMPYPWSAYGSTSSNDGKGTSQPVDRREAALLKFRQKRKERCFDKKIRYINRKKLAERRPRVKGQFVRKVNGIDVDLNGQPTGTEFDDEDEEEEED